MIRNRTVTDSVVAIFQALSDPTRRSLLDLLRLKGEQPAGSIAEAFPVSRPAISKHLRVLRQARLVREHRRGRNRLYQLDPKPLLAVESWLSDYRIFWQTRLTHLKAYAEAESTSRSNFKKHKSNLKRRKMQ